MRLHELLATCTQQLQHAYPHADEARQYAWWLIQALFKKNKAELIAHDINTTAEQRHTINTWINEHVINHKPLQYIIGSVPFIDCTIAVAPPVLIPRPETEEWVVQLIEQLKPLNNKKLNILDMCTGSGCIAIALAQALPDAHIYAIDINPNAIKLTQQNCVTNNTTNVTVIESDLFTALPPDTRFDLIVSNPPYIAHNEWKTLDPSVKDWEDTRALCADDNGFALIKKITDHTPQWIKPNNEMKHKKIPQLLFEIGHMQADQTHTIMRTAGFDTLATWQDLAGRDRVVSGRIANEMAMANSIKPLYKY